jgi:anti-sigma regulatory factor (Ser/Thr protein kinase)
MSVEVKSQTFHHEALFYAGEDEFLAGTVPFVQEATATDEAVLVATSAEKHRVLEAELDGDPERVQFADVDWLGRNPARLLPLWRAFVDENTAEGRAVRGIGEPTWPGRTPAELAECRRHESLLNLAFAQSPAWRLLCLYDAEGLDDEVLSAAELTHPHVAEHGIVRDSPAYDSAAAEHPFDGEFPAIPDDARQLRFTRDEMGAVRQLAYAFAGDSGLGAHHTEDLILAVDEVATNSIRHGGGEGDLRLWLDERVLLCEVQDSGRIEDPLAGLERPELESGDGRGLWIANQVCDLVQIRSVSGRTTVRIHMHLH